jgi:DnaJ-class molecular chaperone
MRGYEIPESFRETCSCCQGTGQHTVCSLIPVRCEECNGAGVRMNRLGWDMLQLMEKREAPEQVG